MVSFDGVTRFRRRPGARAESGRNRPTQADGLAIPHIPMLGNDDGSIRALNTDLDQSDDMLALGGEAEIFHVDEIKGIRDPRKQIDILLFIEGAAPRKLWRNEQFKVLGQAACEACYLTTGAAVIKGFDQCACALGRIGVCHGEPLR
jgi:hypothetical protein